MKKKSVNDAKALPKSFHLKGHATGFHPQTPNLQLR